MSEPNREAVEAAWKAWFACVGTGEKEALRIALTAALPHLLAAKDAEIARIMAAVGKIEALLEIPEDERGFDFGTINRAITAKDAQIAAVTQEAENWEHAANLWMGKALERAQAISAARAALEMSGGVK